MDMDENMTTVDTITEETGPQTEETDSFLNGWEDETEPQEEAEPEPQAEVPEVPEAPEATPPDKPEEPAEQPEQPPEQQQPPEQPRQYMLQYMGEQRQVSEPEMVVLAQKGMDYDRIRAKYEESKPVMSMFNTYAQRAGMSLKDYINFVRAQTKQEQGLTEEQARHAIELEDREAVLRERETAEQARQQQANADFMRQQQVNMRRQADILEFQRLYPNAAQNPQSIPKEVWDKVRQGSSLVNAYSSYALQQAEARRQAAEARAANLEKNWQNQRRSTGSMVSSGGEGVKDSFLMGFDED